MTSFRAAIPFSEKVMAYIVRRGAAVTEILVFDHVDMPEAGVQLPAGTIDNGEIPRMAAIREVHEETGLSDFSSIIFLGSHFYYYWPPKTLLKRYCFLFVSEDKRDEWVHVVQGAGEDAQMRFRIYWLPINHSLRLTSDFGLYLRNTKELIEKGSVLSDSE